MRNADLSNSIYQQRNSNGSALTVKDGMLINNRPDGMTGIAFMAGAKKEMKQMKKVQMMAESVALGNKMSKSEDCGCGY